MMTPDRWRTVEELYHAASDRPAEDRAVLLAEACHGDEDLRREVEELLEQSDDPESLLDRPARPRLDHPELQPGHTLGPYRILELIGSGGMGRVYKALDTRLGRTVAIKISRAGFTGRFRREARAVAALNHPHICTLYDLGPNYLVMEFVEGAPVKGPLPLLQALKVAIAIADALDSAHRKGVVHRDLKPANILLTESGPKLLDFGLAKLEAAPSIPESITWTSTSQATIAGTMQYMAPEQLQGRGADVRSDIFSLGLVLFEMLTGRPAFDADNTASLIAAVLTSHPHARLHLPNLPADLERVLDRTLAKDPENRWQSARDLKAALELIAAPAPPPPASARGRRTPWILAGVFASIAAVLAWMQWGAAILPEVAVEVVTAKTPREPLLLSFDRKGRSLGSIGGPGDYSNPAFSPDGKRLAVAIRNSTRRRDIWIFDIATGARTALTNDPADETNPVWSPDGSEIAYCSARLGPRDIYVRPVNGGPERLLHASTINKNPLDWARDGSAIYYNVDRPQGGHDIWMLPLGEGEKKPAVFLRTTDNRDWLAVSPDSRLMLFRAGGHPGNRLFLRPLAPDSPELSVPGDISEGHWGQDSRQFYYVHRGRMMAQQVSAKGSDWLLGKTASLFQVPQPNTFGRNFFTVSPDGQRFVMRVGE